MNEQTKQTKQAKQAKQAKKNLADGGRASEISTIYLSPLCFFVFFVSVLLAAGGGAVVAALELAFAACSSRCWACSFRSAWKSSSSLFLPFSAFRDAIVVVLSVYMSS